MRRAPSSSARGVALAAAFCALSIASGCGRETFDLLPDSASTVAGNGAGAGKDAGGFGGSAASGNAGGGSAGKAAAAGAGGRFGIAGGNAGNFQCNGEGGCPDEDPSSCPPSSPFCFSCRMKSDCAFLDAKICDMDVKHCVQCLKDDDCLPNERCNQHNQRCAKACTGKDSCPVDGQHLVCSAELGVCVSCTTNDDCASYGGTPNGLCYLNTCIECYENRQCASQWCVRGRCSRP